jgi:hypothetical protein
MVERIDRRKMIKLLAASGAVAALPSFLNACGSIGLTEEEKRHRWLENNLPEFITPEFDSIASGLRGSKEVVRVDIDQMLNAAGEDIVNPPSFLCSNDFYHGQQSFQCLPGFQELARVNYYGANVLNSQEDPVAVVAIRNLSEQVGSVNISVIDLVKDSQGREPLSSLHLIRDEYNVVQRYSGGGQDQEKTACIVLVPDRSLTNMIANSAYFMPNPLIGGETCKPYISIIFRDKSATIVGRYGELISFPKHEEDNGGQIINDPYGILA